PGRGPGLLALVVVPLDGEEHAHAQDQHLERQEHDREPLHRQEHGIYHLERENHGPRDGGPLTLTPCGREPGRGAGRRGRGGEGHHYTPVGLEAARLNPFVSGPALRGVRTPSRTLAGHCAGRRYRTRPWAPPARGPCR